MDSQIATELGCQVGNLPFKYLGRPLGGRLLCCANWNLAVDVFWLKLSIWKARHLSIGGRLTLIKSVLCYVPIYPLSVRLPPVRIKNLLDGIMSRFLLGGAKDDRKLHLVSWESITKPFNRGGLGVLDLGGMNTVLLVKWIYRYGNENDRIWRRVVTATSAFDPISLIMKFNGRNKKSSLVNLIGSFLHRDKRVSRIASESFRIFIGNSYNSEF